MNTSWNKTTYSAIAGALFILAAALCSQFNIQIKPELWAALQGISQALIPALVPNKDA